MKKTVREATPNKGKEVDGVGLGREAGFYVINYIIKQNTHNTQSDNCQSINYDFQLRLVVNSLNVLDLK